MTLTEKLNQLQKDITRIQKVVATMRRKVAAAVKKHQKLQERIAKLQAEGSIIWMSKDAEIVAGCGEWYVKSDSLNTDPDAAGNWYYILTCDEHGYTCRCDSVKPCKHITALSKSFQPTEAERAEAEAISQRLQADLVLWQAEQYMKDVEQRSVAPLNTSNQGFSLLRV